MELPTRLTTALAAMAAAIDRLEAATQGGPIADLGRDDPRAEIEEDRMRLAGELDLSLTRSAALQAAADDVGGRLDRVALALRALLADDDAPGVPDAPA